MNGLKLFEQAQLSLDQGDYENAIALLESCIEDDPEELTYYWYLGLVYLLQENEELAQEIWLSVFLQGNSEEVEQWTAQLISFLEIKVQESIVTKKLGNAKIIYQAISLINSEHNNIELLNSLVEALSIFASTLSFNKDYENASVVYLDALNLNPNHVISWHSLALNYYFLEKYSEAEESIKKAILLNSLLPENYHILGLILEKNQRNTEAINSYLTSIQKNPKLIASYNNLGYLYLKNNQSEKAIEVFHKVLSMNSLENQVQAFYNLGSAYQFLENHEKADFYLGNSAYLNGQYKVAISYFEDFFSVDISNMSEIDIIDTYVTLAKCYIATNQPLLAISLIEKGLGIFSDNISLKRINQSILPIIYKNTYEIEFYRARFFQLLKKLIEETKLTNYEESQKALSSLGIATNYYLAYQGYNDLEINKKYGLHSYTVIKNLYPQWCQLTPNNLLIANKKIRVGYLSARLHTLGKLYLGWLKYHDCNKFEIYVYDVSGYEENAQIPFIEFRDNFKIHSDFFKIITGGINDICISVTSDNLDILVFPDIGLEPKINQLCCLRLSPIQCTSWGNPTTSGSPTVDYFLSSDLMEPLDAQDYYSEQLVRLPNLGFLIECPSVPTFYGQRSDFQLKDDAIIYLCSQCLLKYLPQHDYFFPSIAQRNQLSQFIFFDSFLGPVTTDSFIKRIEKAFAEFELDYHQYCVFFPQIETQKYLSLNCLSDVFLDNFSFSGGFTTVDAIACSLPIVTCPGKIMRARQSYGMLQMIEVTETIAETEEEYIEIAVRLGLDHDWRKRIREKMKANKHRLFNDQDCVRGLEAFFEEAVQKHSRIELISGDL